MKKLLLLLLLTSSISFYCQTQVGDDIIVINGGNNLGAFTTLSPDGTMVSMSATNDSDVYIYELVNNNWQLKGNPITYLNYGREVAISQDNSTILVSGGDNLRSYRFVNGDWQQFGNDIPIGVGLKGLRLNGDGTIVVGSAIYASSNGYNENGLVKVFKNVNDTWVQLGTDIQGIINEDRIGFSVDINLDGSIIALTSNDIYNNNINGAVSIYHLLNDDWSQLGNTIFGDQNDSLFGELALNGDGTRIVISAPFKTVNGFSNYGSFKVFELAGNNWEQIGNEIFGSSEYGTLGLSIEFDDSGNRVAVSSNNSDVNGYYSIGSIYQLSDSNNWIKDNNDVFNFASTNSAYKGKVSLSSDGLRLALSQPAYQNGTGRLKVFDFLTLDLNPPTALCQDITIQLGTNGTASITATDVDNGSYDTEGDVILSIDNDTFSCADIGVVQVTLTVTDEYNTASCMANVTIEPFGSTTVTEFTNCPTTDFVVNTDAGECGAIVDFGFMDPVLTTISYSAEFIDGSYSADNCNLWNDFRNQLTSDLNYTSVTMSGSEDPTGITLSDPNLVAQIANGLKTITSVSADDGTNIWNTGNCVGAELSINKAICGCGAGYTMRPCIGTFQWGGINDPNTCSGISQIMTLSFTVETAISAPDFTAVCNGVVTQTEGLASGSLFPIGTTPITYVLTDDLGNTDTCSFNVVVNSTVVTEFTNCPTTDFVVDTDVEECGAIVDFGFMEQVSTTVSYTADFINGAYASDNCNLWNNFRNQLTLDLNYTSVTMSGSEDPIGITLSDPNLVAQIAEGLRLGSVLSVNDGVNTWNTGVCSNSSQESTIIAINTNTCGCDAGYKIAPCLNEWGGIDEANTCTGVSQTMTLTFTADTNSIPDFTAQCNGVVAQTEGLSSGSFFPIGTTPVTYVLTDDLGNTDTCSFNVVVNSTVVTEFTNCPTTDFLVNNDAGECGAIVDFGFTTQTASGLSVPDFTAQCNGVVTQTEGLESGSLFPIGTTPVTYVLIDDLGNTNTCTFNVLVTYNETPTITCPSDIIVSTNLGDAIAAVTVPQPTYSGNGTSTDINGSGSTTSLYFDGVDDRVALANSPALATWTLETWIYLDGSQQNNSQTIYSNYFSGGTSFGVFISGRRINPNTPGGSFLSNTVMTNQHWYHIAITYDGNTVQIYLDGILDGSLAITNAQLPGGFVEMGVEESNPNFQLAGALDDFRIWDSASSQTDIQNRMNNILNGDEAGLALYLPFEEGLPCSNNTAVSQVLDQSSNTNNGTLFNFDLTTSSGNCISNFSNPADAIAGGGVNPLAAINDYNNTNDASGDYPIGTTTVTWTITDACGATETCSMNITVNDETLFLTDSLFKDVDIRSDIGTNTVVVSGQLSQKTEFLLFDIRGSLVARKDLDIATTANSMDVSLLSDGVYIAKLVGQDSSIKIKKLVIN